MENPKISVDHFLLDFIRKAREETARHSALTQKHLRPVAPIDGFGALILGAYGTSLAVQLLEECARQKKYVLVATMLREKISMLMEDGPLGCDLDLSDERVTRIAHSGMSENMLMGAIARHEI